MALKLNLDQSVIHYYWQGYSLDQISKILDITESRVKKILIRNELPLGSNS
jgi:DNA-directed RNA polymerase specialized sigma24 family protein